MLLQIFEVTCGSLLLLVALTLLLFFRLADLPLNLRHPVFELLHYARVTKESVTILHPRNELAHDVHRLLLAESQREVGRGDWLALHASNAALRAHSCTRGGDSSCGGRWLQRSKRRHTLNVRTFTCGVAADEAEVSECADVDVPQLCWAGDTCLLHVVAPHVSGGDSIQVEGCNVRGGHWREP
jgi:hypothetical protein